MHLDSLDGSADGAHGGSYNWTHESEEENHENLLILRDPLAVEAYTHEFEALWAEADHDDS